MRTQAFFLLAFALLAVVAQSSSRHRRHHHHAHVQTDKGNSESLSEPGQNLTTQVVMQDLIARSSLW
jgi:hypothetical protein